MNFFFSINQRVVTVVHIETIVAEMGVVPESLRLDRMTIVERISTECIGGTQLFYHCQRWDGSVGRYAEASLMLAEEGFTLWVEAFMKQHERLHPKETR